MVALTQDRDTPERDGDDYQFGMAAGATIFAGSLVVLDTSGNAVPGGVGAGLIAVGRAQEHITNLGGAGAVRVPVRRGFFLWANAAADPISKAEIGDDCYILDDQTVARTNGGGTRSRAGRVIDVAGGQVWVATGIALDGSPAPVPIDPPAVATPSISVAVTGSLAEGGTMTVTVTASATSASAMSCDIAVSGTGANPVSTADFGGAFPAWAGVTITPGQTTATRTFAATDDADVEPDETGRVTISNPVGCTIASATADFTVLNNDSGGGTLYPEPFVAEFGTLAALGAFYGTALDSGGATWTAASGNAEAAANFQISTAGYLSGPGLTVANNRFAAFDTGARTGNSRRWTSIKAGADLSLLSSSRYAIGVSITNNAAADSQYMSIAMGSGPDTNVPTALALSERGAGASTSSLGSGGKPLYLENGRVDGIQGPIASATLASNAEFNGFSADAFQNLRTAHAITISGLDYGTLRQPQNQPAMTLAYSGAGIGSIALNGATNTNSRTARLYVDGVEVGNLPLLRGTGETNHTSMGQLVDWINGFAGFTAILLDPSARAAELCTPTMTSPTATWSSPVILSAAPLTFGWSVDTHVDGLQSYEDYHDGQFQYAFITFKNCLAGQLYFVGGQCPDITAGWIETESNSPQPCQISHNSLNPTSHHFIHHSSFAGSTFAIRTDINPYPDTVNCEFSDNVVRKFDWVGSATPNFKVKRIHAFDTASDSGLLVDSSEGGVREEQIPGYAEADFTPIAGGLLMNADGSYRGSRLPSGAWNIALAA